MQSRPGDKCQQENCEGRLCVYTTRINFALKHRVRYLHCQVCGHKPDGNKWIVPLEYAPSRVVVSVNVATSSSTPSVVMP